MLNKKIDLGMDQSRNTTCIEPCNACIYNGKRHLDLTDICAFDNDGEMKLVIGPVSNEKEKSGLKKLYEYLDTEKEIEVVIYPIEELALHRAVFWCKSIAIAEDEDGDVSVILEYLDNKDEITYEFRKVSMEEENAEAERIRHVVSEEVKRRQNESLPESSKVNGNASPDA